MYIDKSGISIRSNGSDIGNDFMLGFPEIFRESNRKEKEIIRKIKETGAKACHPNDGWVKRDEDGKPLEAIFCYPDFRYEIEIGDLIALREGDRRFSLHRVTGWRDNPWAFNELGSRRYFLETVDAHRQDT